MVLDDEEGVNYNDLVYKTLPVRDPDIIVWGDIMDAVYESSKAVSISTFSYGLMFSQDGMKFYYFDYPLEEVKHEVVAFLVMQMPKYQPDKGRAFSYFSVVGKNWLILHNKMGILIPLPYTASHPYR